MTKSACDKITGKSEHYQEEAFWIMKMMFTVRMISLESARMNSSVFSKKKTYTEVKTGQNHNFVSLKHL